MNQTPEGKNKKHRKIETSTHVKPNFKKENNDNGAVLYTTF